MPFATKHEVAGDDLLVITNLTLRARGVNRDTVDVVGVDFQDDVEATDDEYEVVENPSGDERN